MEGHGVFRSMNGHLGSCLVPSTPILETRFWLFSWQNMESRLTLLNCSSFTLLPSSILPPIARQMLALLSEIGLESPFQQTSIHLKPVLILVAKWQICSGQMPPLIHQRSFGLWQNLHVKMAGNCLR